MKKTITYHITKQEADEIVEYLDALIRVRISFTFDTDHKSRAEAKDCLFELKQGLSTLLTKNLPTPNLRAVNDKGNCMMCNRHVFPNTVHDCFPILALTKNH